MTAFASVAGRGKQNAGPQVQLVVPEGALRRRSNLLTVLMLLCLAYFLLPLFWLVVASTKTVAGLFSTFGLWFSAADFDFLGNVGGVFAEDGGIYLRWLGNTALYAVVSAVGAALLATLGGYGFAKFTFPGKTPMFAGVLAAVMVPPTVLAVPTYLLFSEIGLVNTPLAVIIPSLLTPFGLYLMRVYAADAVPDSLIEAARIDGAGEFRIFWQVALRLLIPGFVTVVLFSLVATWNNYFLPLIMLNDPQWFPITVGLARWNDRASAGGGAEPIFNLVITGSLISIVPLIVAFVFLQRYWQSGLSVGAIKD
jgi:multiple sugar transport system permease protein